MAGQELAMRVDMKRMGGEMVPIWNGSLEDWEDYTVRAGIYCRGVDTWKVGSRIANLIQSLEGKAWDAIRNLSENERITLQQDLTTFLSFLKEQCLPTAIPELGRRFREWQKFRRTRKETMRVYIRRYRLHMNRLELSMRTVDNGSKALDKLRRTIAVQRMLLTDIKTPSVRSKGSHASNVSNRSFRTRTTQQPSPSPPNSPPRAYPRNWTSRQRQEDLQPDPQEGDEEEGEWERVSQHGWEDSGWHDWNSKGWQGSKWWTDDAPSRNSNPKPIDKPLTPLEELAKAFALLELQVGMNDPILLDLQKLVAERWRENALPSILTGWHLLNGSGLNATERSAIIATASMNKRDDESLDAIDLNAMEKALQLAWPDTELVERDEKVERKEDRRGKKGRAFVVNSSGSEDSEQGYQAERYEAESDNSSGLGEHDAQLIAELSDEEERDEFANAVVARNEGKRMMNQGRRTFIQAKTLIRDIRKTRGKPRFFPKTKHANMTDDFLAEAFAQFVNKAKQPKRSSSQPSRLAIASTAYNQKSGNKGCYKCGKTDHQFKDCTKNLPAKAFAAIEDASMADSGFNELVAAKEARIQELRRQLEARRLAQLEAEERELLAELNSATPPPVVPKPKEPTPVPRAAAPTGTRPLATAKIEPHPPSSPPPPPSPTSPAQSSTSSSSSSEDVKKRKRAKSDRGRPATRSAGRRRRVTSAPQRVRTPPRKVKRVNSPRRPRTPPRRSPTPAPKIRNRWNTSSGSGGIPPSQIPADIQDHGAVYRRLAAEESERRQKAAAERKAKAAAGSYVSSDDWHSHFRGEDNRPGTPVKSAPVKYGPPPPGNSRPVEPVRYKPAPDTEPPRWKPAPPFKSPPTRLAPSEPTGSGARHSWEAPIFGPPPKSEPTGKGKGAGKEAFPRELSTREIVALRKTARQEQKEQWISVGYKGHTMYEEPCPPERFFKTSDAWSESFAQLTAEEQEEHLKGRQLRNAIREANREERIRKYGTCLPERRQKGIKLQVDRRSRLEMVACPIWDHEVTSIPKEKRWVPEEVGYEPIGESLFLFSWRKLRSDLEIARQRAKKGRQYLIVVVPPPLEHESEFYDADGIREPVLSPMGAQLSQNLLLARSAKEFRRLCSSELPEGSDPSFRTHDHLLRAQMMKRDFEAEGSPWTLELQREWEQQYDREAYDLPTGLSEESDAEEPSSSTKLEPKLTTKLETQPPPEVKPTEPTAPSPTAQWLGSPKKEVKEEAEVSKEKAPEVKPETADKGLEPSDVFESANEADSEVAHMISDEALIGESTSDNAVLTVDCGATGSLLSLHTLDDWDKQGYVNIIKINPDVQKKYKVANGQSVLTCSQISVQFANKPELGAVTFDCTEAEGVPPLLGMNFLKDGVLNMAKQTLSVNGRVTRLQRRGNGHLVINLASCESQTNSDNNPESQSCAHGKTVVFDMTQDDSDNDIPQLTDHSDAENIDGKIHNESSDSEDDDYVHPPQLKQLASTLISKHSSARFRHHGNRQDPDRNSGAAGTSAGKRPEDQDRNDCLPGGSGHPEPSTLLQAGARGLDPGNPGTDGQRSRSSQGPLSGTVVSDQTGPPGTCQPARNSEPREDDQWNSDGQHSAHRGGADGPERGIRPTEDRFHEERCTGQRRILRVGSYSAERESSLSSQTAGGTPSHVFPLLPSSTGADQGDSSCSRAAAGSLATGTRGREEAGTPDDGGSLRRVWKRRPAAEEGGEPATGFPDRLRRGGSNLGFSSSLGGEESQAGRADWGEAQVRADAPVEGTPSACHRNQAIALSDNGHVTSTEVSILALQNAEVTNEDPQTLLACTPMLHKAETSAVHSSDFEAAPPSWEDAAKVCLHDRYYVTATSHEREAFTVMLKKLRPLNCSAQHVTRIIEFCCDEDSEIGIQGKSTPHVEVLRCTLKDDVTTKQGMQRCIDYVREYPGTHLFASIPCTPWSPIQELNIHLHGQSFEEYLAHEREKSLELMGKFITLARIVRSLGGTVCFEWPKGSTGWKEALTQRWIKEFKTIGIVFDGCFFELRSRKTGELIKKPWRFESDNWAIIKAFENSTCTGGHKHQPCEGSETKASGHYPPRMARNIVLAFKRYDINLLQQKREAQVKVETANLLEATANAATQEEVKAFLDLSPKEQQQLLDAAKKVHVNTGHQPPGDLARLLRKNGAPPASRAAMEQVKCSSCHEHKRPESSPVASLSTSTIPWKVLGMDVKEYKTNTHKLKYLLFVDEASRLVKTKLLFKIPNNQHRNATTEEIIRAFETDWEEFFGCPEILRHDPEGSMVSTEIMQAFSAKGIRLLATAGEAHWQLGITERTIQTIFRTAEKIRDEQKLDMEKAISLSTSAHNTTERVHGYTPSQWAFGRNPTWSNTLHEEKEGTNLSRDGNEAFQERLKLQILARKCFEEEILRQKIQRAQRAKHRKDVVFIPGELVFIWRLGTGKLAGTKKTGLHKGAWIGPGIVLGTESREHEGVVFPTAVVWVVINDRLWRCAPEQIRRASEREHAEQTLNQVRPWTFENISRNLILGQYRNVAAEPFPDPENLDDQNPENEGQLPPEDMDEDDEDMPEHPLEPPGRVKRSSAFRDFPGGDGTRYTKKQKRKQNLEAASFIAQTACQSIGKAFFNKAECPDKVLEISFPILEDDRRIRKYLRNPEAFVVTSLRKKRVEIVEKRLTPEEKELIRTAKGKEIKEFLKEAVVARLQQGETVDPNEVMKMRWVLTWKKNDDGSTKGKARLVVLGFQDPHLGTEHTSSPTLNRRSKQLLLQTVVQNSWQLKKGDVTAAFLQGRPLQKCKYALAPTELADAMGLPPGDRVIRLLKSVYGLTTAPLEWYSQVDKVLKELGGRQTAADPCVWIFCNKTGEHIGLVGAHVDDFLIAGDDSPEWKQIIEILLTAFRWTPWEERTFKQCGIVIEQLTDGSIVQHQEEYLSGLEEIPIDTNRSKMLSSNVTEGERTQLRALLGGLQWLVTQTRVDAMIDVNLLQSCVTTATVETILTANKILRKLRAGQSKLFNKKIDEPIHLVAWSDASWANRRDGKSTGGFLVGICGESVLDGKRGHVSVVSWGTNKLKRVARSSMAAEMQALANAEDELHLCRLAWLEFNGRVVDLNFVDECLHEIPGTVIIDAKSIYDSLTSQNQPTQLSEKRTALELLAYLRNTEANGTLTRWVHGGANIADGLTKLGNHPMLQDFLSTSTWALVNDAAQLSGKRRKAQGLDTLAATAAEDDQFSPLAWKALHRVWPDYCLSDCSSDN